jgi:hypothetical protein
MDCTGRFTLLALLVIFSAIGEWSTTSAFVPPPVITLISMQERQSLPSTTGGAATGTPLNVLSRQRNNDNWYQDSFRVDSTSRDNRRGNPPYNEYRDRQEKTFGYQRAAEYFDQNNNNDNNRRASSSPSSSFPWSSKNQQQQQQPNNGNMNNNNRYDSNNNNSNNNNKKSWFGAATATANTMVDE